MIATYSKQFVLHFESEQNLQLACLDPIVVLNPILAKFRNVILTSSCFTPSKAYSQLFNFHPKLTGSYSLQLNGSNSLCPIILSKGSDHVLQIY